MSASQPLLKAALVLRNDARAVENLHHAYLYQRRLLKIIIELSYDLNRKTQRGEQSEHWPTKSHDFKFASSVSKHALTAARQAIKELCPNSTAPQAFVSRRGYFGEAKSDADYNQTHTSDPVDVL